MDITAQCPEALGFSKALLAATTMAAELIKAAPAEVLEKATASLQSEAEAGDQQSKEYMEIVKQIRSRREQPDERAAGSWTGCVLTQEEQLIIQQYRRTPQFQAPVRKLLGIANLGGMHFAISQLRHAEHKAAKIAEPQQEIERLLLHTRFTDFEENAMEALEHIARRNGTDYDFWFCGLSYNLGRIHGIRKERARRSRRAGA